MANVLKKGSTLKKNYKSSRVSGAIIYVAGAVCAICGVMLSYEGRVSLAAAVWIAAIVLILIARVTRNRTQMLNAGVSGEENTLRSLEMLPSSYYIVPNVEITVKGDHGQDTRAEVDMAVVGPNGVFIVETKNYSGTISGNWDSRSLNKVKVSGGGNPYSKQVTNPVPQVKRQIFIVKKYLLAHGIDRYINAVVYLSNPDAHLQMSGPKPDVPVLTAAHDGPEGLRRTITDAPGRKLMPESEVIKIAHVLENAHY